MVVNFVVHMDFNLAPQSIINKKRLYSLEWPFLYHNLKTFCQPLLSSHNFFLMIAAFLSLFRRHFLCSHHFSAFFLFQLLLTIFPFFFPISFFHSIFQGSFNINHFCFIIQQWDLFEIHLLSWFSNIPSFIRSIDCQLYSIFMYRTLSLQKTPNKWKNQS